MNRGCLYHHNYDEGLLSLHLWYKLLCYFPMMFLLSIVGELLPRVLMHLSCLFAVSSAQAVVFSGTKILYLHGLVTKIQSFAYLIGLFSCMPQLLSFSRPKMLYLHGLVTKIRSFSLPDEPLFSCMSFLVFGRCRFWE